MHMPIIPSIHDRRSFFTPTLPSDKPNATLNTLGVAGLLGGDEASSAMAAVHVYQDRRWLGWYNSPGSYQVARRYGLLTKSRFLDSSCGVHTDPAVLFKLNDGKGPKFKAAHSGTIIQETGHLAYLFTKDCAGMEGIVVVGRQTNPIAVTIAELDHVPTPQVELKHTNAYTPIFASIPILVSIGACITCGVFEDWYPFLMILMGILANGISCRIIGSGKFVFTHPDPAAGCPAGDGILISNKEIVLLKGVEGAVNCITRGRFSLSFDSEAEYQNIGCCSVLLIIQTLTQLLLIPQGSLFGKIMFIISLGVSWIYNSWLSTSHTKIRDILFDSVLDKPPLTKYIFGTRTTMVVFVLHILQPEEPGKILDELLPNNTGVWKAWKETVAQRFCNSEKLEFVEAEWSGRANQEEKDLLKTLYKDAETGYFAYLYHSAPQGDDVDDLHDSCALD